jgi:hypothetical protein
MANMKDATIRFAVGEPDGDHSSIWRLWTRAAKNDVYIAMRNLAGTFKVSLHGAKPDKSASWRVAFVDPNSPYIPPGGNRAVEVWEPPPEIAPGWTRAFAISVPATEVVRPLHRTADISKVEWVPKPPDGCATEFDVFMSSPEITRRDEWPGREAMNTRCLFRAPLADGSAVWLLTFTAEVADVAREQIEWVRRQLDRLQNEQGEADPDGVDLRQFAIAKLDADGTRFFFDLAP